MNIPRFAFIDDGLPGFWRDTIEWLPWIPDEGSEAMWNEAFARCTPAHRDDNGASHQVDRL